MKHSFVFLIPLALGVFGLASGCSSDEAGDTPASIDRQSLPKKVAEAFCENVTDCCTVAGIDQDMDTCLANAEETFDVSLAGESSELKYDGTRADDCVAAYKSQTSKCGQLTAADVKAFLSACGGLYVGTLSAGETCTSSEECSGKLSTCKKEAADDATGKCAPLAKRAHAGSGDDCATTCSEATCTYNPADNDLVTDACYASDKLWCNEDNKCEALGSVGDACNVVGCKAGLFCADGACAPQRTAGQPCDPAVLDACEDGTLCDSTDSECKTLHAAGAVCVADPECESGTCRGGVCAINNATEEACSGDLPTP